MDRDSIIARPTNKVLVMVPEASGCCASEFSAVATARPSLRAGPITPMLIVIPDVTIDATAIVVVKLSKTIMSSSVSIITSILIHLSSVKDFEPLISISTKKVKPKCLAFKLKSISDSSFTLME
jgi:hypothetical protein